MAGDFGDKDKARRKGGGKDSRGGKSEARRPSGPARHETRRTRVGGGPGVAVLKVSRVDLDARCVIDGSVSYSVEFDGHPALPFPKLNLALARAKEPPPEAATAATPAVEAAEAVESTATGGDEAAASA